MTEAHLQKTRYHDELCEVGIEQTMHVARFAEGRVAYDRFYDLAARVGERIAAETLPDDARVVAELAAATPDRNKQVERLMEALNASLETEMRSIAEASVIVEGSIVGRLRADLLQLARFRKECLDGIDGKFWDVLKQGHGASKKEPGRMLNRVLAAWCEVYEIKPATMTAAAMDLDMIYVVGTHWNMSSAAVAEKCKSYPFDIVADLEEAKGWDELDPEAVEALLSHLQQSRNLSR
jgi:hypothetical protein